MATVDNFFSAVPDQNRLMAFANKSEGHGQLPLYKFGVVGYGSAGGMVGCGGAAITRLLGPYSTFAGVHGTARDFTGVAGTLTAGVKNAAVSFPTVRSACCIAWRVPSTGSRISARRNSHGDGRP
jgi:hypothetical protein